MRRVADIIAARDARVPVDLHWSGNAKSSPVVPPSMQGTELENPKLLGAGSYLHQRVFEGFCSANFRENINAVTLNNNLGIR